MSNQKISDLLKSDFNKYNASEKAKANILKAANQKANGKTKAYQNSIVPLFGIQGSYAKAAMIAVLIASSLFAFKFSEVSKNRFKETQPQLLDSSTHGIDTSLIFNNEVFLR